MLFKCWPTVFEAGSTLKQRWVIDRVSWVLAINLLAAAGGETSPVFVYKNGESSSCN